MHTTFAQLGIPFPLYEAPIESPGDSEYAGLDTCSVCGTTVAQCFSLGVGTAVIIPCPQCGAANGLDVDDKAGAACRDCSARIEFPVSIASQPEPKVCYTCLRSGKAALSKDTEFGMISWDQAFSGVTHGLPDLRQDQFESVMTDTEHNWVGVKLPQDMMFELLRTPTCDTWQGERWLFCCRYPMTFIGEWDQEHFKHHDPQGNGEQLYRSVVEDVDADTWQFVGVGLAVYVFVCKRCGRHRAHSDSS